MTSVLVTGKDALLDCVVVHLGSLTKPCWASDLPYHSAATFASGSPVALAMKGTVREARGLTSST